MSSQILNTAISLDQTLHALHMNLGFGPLGIQNVDNVTLRTDEDHDEILRDKVFFEESAHLFIGD